MPRLTSFVHYACGFVDFDQYTSTDAPILLESFVRFCDSYKKIIDYYLIAHTETDTLHIHFIFYSHSQVQIMTYYNKMRSWFVDKYHLTRDEYGIQIDKCESINGHLKYLIHQDKESIALGKKKYEVDDFVSNVDTDIIESMIRSRKGTVDAYLLRDAVLDCDNDFDLMVKLSLPVYHRYRYEIQIIRENRVRLVQQREEERKEKLENALPF